jgi:hypothetical protein
MSATGGRTPVRSTNHGVTQATTQTGKVIHESSRHGYPLCGLYVSGIWYTSEPANCPKCAIVKEAGEAA